MASNYQHLASNYRQIVSYKGVCDSPLLISNDNTLALAHAYRVFDLVCRDVTSGPTPRGLRPPRGGALSHIPPHSVEKPYTPSLRSRIVSLPLWFKKLPSKLSER